MSKKKESERLPKHLSHLEKPPENNLFEVFYTRGAKPRLDPYGGQLEVRHLGEHVGALHSVTLESVPQESYLKLTITQLIPISNVRALSSDDEQNVFDYRTEHKK